MQEDPRPNFFYNFFVPRKNYFVTPVIFFLNLMLYVAVSVQDGNFFLPTGETILLLGGDTPSLTLNGEWWRIITACFLHFGILHFASNMFALIQLGKIIENFVGSLRLAIVYLFCGISGGMASNWWYSDTGMGVSAGASGAIFGLLGFFLALVTTEFVRKEVRWPMIKSIGGSVLLNLALSTFAEFNNAAHLGGLFSGLISGYLVWIIYKISNNYREIIYTVLHLFFCLAMFLFLLPAIPKTSILLNELFERIEKSKRETAADVDRMMKSSPIVESDTTIYVQKWDAPKRKIDSLKLFGDNESLMEVINYQEKEIKLRKRETSLLVSINSGNTSKVKELKIIQESLRGLTSLNEK
ncbi:MAG: rhomboid family intramembrane serine protease [Bacteroidota bacterium]